jgi:ABC-type transport system substrate-binding protein
MRFGFLPRSLALVLTCAVMPALVAGAEKPKHGGVLTLAIGKDITATNPLIRTFSIDESVRDLMFEPLLAVDNRGIIQPNLAQSWEVSGGGKTYVFKLRKGVKFHNGQEMTAEDAKFAMDYTMNPKNGARGYERLDVVERVETPDKNTLKVTLKKVSAAFLYDLTEIQAFSVIPKGSLQEGIDKPAQFPPGTGPFKFVEWQPEQRIVVERFNDYWGHKAFLDRVILKPLANTTTRLNALRAGDVDMIERAPYEWVEQIKSGKLRGLTTVEAPYASYHQLVFNVAIPPFNNKKFRQAIAYALDKKEILQATFFGFGTIADQKYPPGHAWHIKGVPAPSNDLNKARALLAESGYDGKAVDIMIRQGSDSETAASTIQAQLKRIGLNINVRVFEYSAQRTLIQNGTFTFDFMGSGVHPDPSSTYGMELGCIPDLKKRSSNYSGWCDKEVDALLKSAEIELDVQKRRELFKQILTRAGEEVAVVPITFVSRFFALRDYVKNFSTGQDGEFRVYGGGLNYAWLDK